MVLLFHIVFSLYIIGFKKPKALFGWLQKRLMLIRCERKILLNGWLILSDKFKRTGPKLIPLDLPA
jgi:hypothetical protein